MARRSIPYARGRETALAKRISPALAIIAASVLILSSYSTVHAQAVSDEGYYRFATAAAFNNFLGNGHQCSDPICTAYGTTDGGQVYTADYVAAQLVCVYTPNMPNGGTISWQATKPDNSVESIASVTWDASTGYWNWSDGEQWGDQGDTPIFFLVGTPVNCQTAGGWSLQTLESGSLLLSHNFSLSHDSPLLGITSPTDNQLFDLDQQNYTATGPVPFVALTNTGNFINWAANLQYATSGGYGSMTDGPRNFQTATAEEHDETYQSEGGQVTAVASTTVSDGSTIQDCVTFYIDGPQSGIPDATITAQLETSSQSYPRSKSYPSDGTGTQALMAQVAATESSYAQFQTPALCNGHPDLWSLDADAGILAKWSEEPYTDDQSGTCIGTDGGSHIGLMQVVTDSDQLSDPNAWNWITNAADGVGLFSGTPPAEYGTKSNKMQTAANYEKGIMSSYPHGSLPMLQGWQLEDMALLLYGPGASSDLGKQYWEPACAGTVNSKGQCSTGWQWTENRSGNPAGTQYADGVRAETVP